MAETYPKNIILTLKATVVPQENIDVSIYEWTINKSIVVSNPTELMSLNTNDLDIGDNTISLRVQNSCGAWSEYVNKAINIVDENAPIPDEIKIKQEFEVVVDKPVTNIEVIMQLTGMVFVTVKNQLGTTIPNASVTIDTVTKTTDASGIATLNGISYGTKKGTVTVAI